MIPKYPFMVRIRRRTGAEAGSGRMQEDRWFESHGAAKICFDQALKQPLVSGATIMVVLDELSKEQNGDLHKTKG
jgi:hypothetical protein